MIGLMKPRTINLMPEGRKQALYLAVDSIESVHQDASGGIPYITTKSGRTHQAPGFDSASDLVIALERIPQ